MFLRNLILKLLIKGMKPRQLFNAGESAGVLSADDTARLKAVVGFGRAKVADIMVPRDEVKYVKASETFGPVVLHELHEAGHTRFPVVQKDLDSIVGILHLDDAAGQKNEIQKVKDAMREQIFDIQATESLDDALRRFLRVPSSLFIVKDKHGNCVGLLSLEDVLSALLGRRKGI